MEMSRLTRDGTTEPVSRDQILRRERRQVNNHFPCSADHEQDWQPYPVDPYSCYTRYVLPYIPYTRSTTVPDTTVLVPDSSSTFRILYFVMNVAHPALQASFVFKLLRSCLNEEIESVHRICRWTYSVDRSYFGSKRSYYYEEMQCH